ncbi:MAG: porin [Myxococcales bacterium]|nr:MAG: porin [Myxococcales bacterium]
MHPGIAACRWARTSALAACLCAFSYASDAAAQSREAFALDQFHPAPAGDRFFGTQGGDPGGHLSPRLLLLGEYAYRPLVLYENDGEDRVGNVVSDQLFLHLGASIALWERLSLSVNLPLALVNEGSSPASGAQAFASPSGAALGDLRLGARVRFLGEPDSAFQLGLAGYVWLPTGDQDSFAGDGSVRALPALVANGEIGSFVYAANAGVTLRGERRFAATTVGTQIQFGAAAGLLALDKKLQIGPELYGTTTTESAFERDTTNLEAILGLKYRAGPIVFGAAAGPGITRGLGTPTLRAILSVAYVPLPEVERAPSDRDRDGILDEQDVCPDRFGIPSTNPNFNGCPDTDKDGVFDDEDACNEVPGKRSEDPKKNGCPEEKDRDKDGILDDDDACPDEPGVASEDPRKNGCPSDRDGDGILDKDDACPDLKGKADPDPEKNGCPGDTDGDGIRDDQDACPREKGKRDPDPEKNGCPSLVRVTGTEIVILQQVQFKTASDVILPSSDDLLQQVASVLKEHPELSKVEIQGHTDNRGNAGYNQNLSQRRAASVVKWLTNRGGVEASRLTPKGYGKDDPIDTNDTEEGRQKNRRVQFRILTTDKATNVKDGAP